MIIQKIDGGLGNQMFQYAFGFSMSLDVNDDFKFENHALHYRNRKFMLDNFEISAKELELPFAKKNSKLFKIVAALERRALIKLKFQCNWIIEKEEDYYKYNENYQHKKLKNQYFVGYYQNYQYFDRYRNKILQEFRIKTNRLSNEIIENGKLLAKTTTCSVHIRKGDYPEGWLVNAQYYIQAMHLIRENYDSVRFLVFCEDKKYAKKILQNEKDIEFASDLGAQTDLDEFYLMSSTKYHIISNSTFSWWAAYLGTNENVIVVCPVTELFISSFYLSEWIKLTC